MQFLRKIFKLPKKDSKLPPSVNATSFLFKKKYSGFRQILSTNSELLKVISDIEEKLRGDQMFGMTYLFEKKRQILALSEKMVDSFSDLSEKPQPILKNKISEIREKLNGLIQFRKGLKDIEFVIPYEQTSKEMIDWIGGKNANLGELVSKAGLPAPGGFAITTSAYEAFMDENDIRNTIVKMIPDSEDIGYQEIIQASNKVQRLFDESRVPPKVSEAIFNAYKNLAGSRFDGPDAPKVALRSSAIGEDSDLSFAGQYLSILNVGPESLIDSYKHVLSSLFSPRAIFYRLQKGVPIEATAMAVACMEMVRSKASGVMYTHHPYNILENTIIINAVWGLGKYAVDGIVTPDTYTLSKETQPELLGVRIHLKPIRLVHAQSGGVVEEAVEPHLQARSCLTDDQAKALADFAVRIERHFQRPQDIEWAIDDQNRIFILQSRPLKFGVQPATPFDEKEDDQEIQGYSILLKGGETAYPGVGSGPAVMVQNDEDLMNFPDDGILIAKSPSPKFVAIMKKARAIVTDSGSITGHMASLAREFMVPALLNTHHATRIIRAGDILTVDAYSRKVYAGRVSELIGMQLTKGVFMMDSPVFHLLKKSAEMIVPLTLTDPKTPEFTPQGCRTIHDIMRFLHENAYREMFQISDLATDSGRISVKLEEPNIPLDLYIIDLGGGLVPETTGIRKVKVNQISSIPFEAVLKGMLREDLSSLEPRPVSLGGFLSVVTRQILTPQNLESERFGDKSYAIISDKYLNFSSRVGYHYSIIDAYCGETETNNYINFEFKGGAADDTRRNRRTRMISSILLHFGFSTEVVADRVTARIHKRSALDILEFLDQLGRLILFTRQMDMLMHTDESVSSMTDCFLHQDYCLKRHT
ncbi:MAG: PEP/pyruvate-binding domain-containing protein [Thermodesulfobacteriota bacterium]